MVEASVDHAPADSDAPRSLGLHEQHDDHSCGGRRHVGTTDHERTSIRGRQLGAGLTFEDLFVYDGAWFWLDVGEDWSSAQMEATAWINGSNAAVVRDNIDGLFEGFPGGANDWLSTDEREAVRNIGPACIEDMNTRLTIDERPSFRQTIGNGTMTFVEDGLALDEVDLVPEDHPETRTCQHNPLQSCREVPVTIEDDMTILMMQDPEGPSNVDFPSLPNRGLQPFTLALDATNMTDATLQVTLPITPGMRLVTESQRWGCDQLGVRTGDLPHGRRSP